MLQHPKRWPGFIPFQGGKLLSQGEVLQMQRRANEESLADHGKNELNGRAHVKDAIRHRPETLGLLRPIGFMGATPGYFVGGVCSMSRSTSSACNA